MLNVLTKGYNLIGLSNFGQPENWMKSLCSEITFKRLVSWGQKVLKIMRSPQARSAPKPVATINKQSMGYFIVKDIESSTSYLKREWATFALKELLDNAHDWLNDHYPAKRPEDKDKRKIIARIWITEEGNSVSKLIHIAVRNSNVDDIPVFTNLKKTFDYDLWFSTKRGQHRMTAGGLGDALKRILGMGYAAWSEVERDAKQESPGEEIIDFELEEKQWNEPVIVRCNETERTCLLTVQMLEGNRWVEIQPSVPTRDIGTDTEVEVTLPAVPDSAYIGRTYYTNEVGYVLHKLREYYNRYKIPKSRTEFQFHQGE